MPLHLPKEPYELPTARNIIRERIREKLSACIQRANRFTTDDIIDADMSAILKHTDKFGGYNDTDLRAEVNVLAASVLKQRKASIRYAYNPTTRKVQRGLQGRVIYYGLNATEHHLPEGSVFVPLKVRPKNAADFWDREQAKGFKSTPIPTTATFVRVGSVPADDAKEPPKFYAVLTALDAAAGRYLEATTYTKPFDTIAENNEWTECRKRLVDAYRDTRDVLIAWNREHPAKATTNADE